ncbi:pectinesterase, partial [Paenibacillus sepulcri]|nr:pectinesterase [Paenibacillus sepulcri]
VIGNSNTTEYKDTAPVMGVTYHYKVTDLNAGGESPHSASVEVLAYDATKPLPPAPSGLKITAAKSISAALAWTPVDGAVSYVIHRADSPEGAYHNLGSVSTTAYTDKTVSPSMTYYYKVSTTALGGESAASDSV